MAKNPPDGMQRVIPHLSYADAPKAIDFLCRAFGFEERLRFPMPDGRLGHAYDRSYRAVDCEGRRWIFSTRVRDVPLEEIRASDYEGELERGA